MIKFGRFSTTPPGAVSYMPAFEDVLSDPEILEVMAFIKARWPLGLRVSQKMLNPGFTGMPARANEIEWTLPPNCTATLQRWRELHRDVAALAGRVPISCVRETRGTTLADAILLDASVEWWLTGIKTPTAAPAA